ncbi:Carbon-nitrogen hydrolase [Rhodotorula kratochvilovae]
MLAAVGQICSTNNVTRNAALCVSLIRRAASARCALLFLPEASDFIADAKEVPKLSASLDESEFVREVRAQAKESAIWVGVGVHEKATEDKCYNTNLLISPDGEIAQAYRKLHLFDVKHSGPGGGIMMESNTTIQGDELLDPQETPIGKVGLLTCYDLRFPEAALSLRRRGAHVIAYPSAFTLTTGPAHWEVLLRARAIENQCYILAPAQVGQHSPSRQTYGHAMIVDPWGSVVAQAPDRPPKFPPPDDVDTGTFVMHDVELEWIEQMRKEMPLWEQRRGDVYPIL